MASPTPFAHQTFSIEGRDLHRELSHEVDSHIKNPSTKWVLNSPDPPGFCQHIFRSVKKTVFPQRNNARSSLSSQKESPCGRIIVVLSSVFPVLIWGRKYTASKFKNDLISGLTLASLSIPQSIGYAALANLAPQYGL
nr:low affinity sulfate transporter 3-like [Tanacetum cinerariifolium]